MTPTLRRALLSTLPLLSVAACDNPVSRHFEWQRHAANVEFAPEPLYCYRTLAKSDCFTQPLDRRESNRLVGNYGPPPGRVVVVAAPPRDRDKMGEVIDHAPLIAPRETVETETVIVMPKQPPGAPIPLVKPTN